MIKNGTICKNIFHEGNSYNIQNTCALDSFIFLIGFLANRDKDVNVTISNKENLFYSLCRKFSDGCIDTEFYKMRLLAVVSLFAHTEHHTNIMQINSSCTIQNLIQKMNIQDFAVKNHTAKHKTHHQTLICLNSHFQIRDEERCSCGESSYQFGKFVWADILYVLNDKTFSSTTDIKLKSIPKFVKIGKAALEVMGFVNFIAPTYQTKQNIGHFQALVQKGTNWLCFDDLKDAPLRCQLLKK